MTEKVKNSSEPRMGTDVPFENVSGSVPTVGSTIRHNERGPGGKFRPREQRIVGPLNRPAGPGGVDSVTGQWIPGVRNNAAQLHDLERVHWVTSRPVHQAKDYSARVEPARKSNAHIPVLEDMINHSMDCPGCGIPSIFSERKVG